MALSNDTGILVLLVYWTWRCDLQGRLVIDLDKLDGIVQEVNTTCTYIAHSCLEPMHSLTATQCPILSARVRLEGVSRADIMAVGSSSSRHWRATSSSSMAQVHYYIYTRKLVRIMSLPPTDLNLFVHVHFQMLLWKAANSIMFKEMVSYTSYDLLVDKLNCLVIIKYSRFFYVN